MSTDIEAVIPHIVVDDAAAALEFYRKALGAEEVMRVPADDGKRLLHSEMKLGGSRVFVRDAFPEHCGSGGKDGSPKTFGGTAVTLHLRVADCDAAVERAAGAGAVVVMPPEDAFWGDRFAVVADPYGHAWSFAHTLERDSA
ncbi:VOC family protein [Pelagibius sp. CAU 1746]|uniref:VOC family protein n=1 Tax=Pelagibius sp. CAU 1746 TaxID=3140370 RepID=UPI00325A5C51